MAEVLITLGIIGVIATITMPTLTANYKSKVFATRAKKSYSLISQAIQRYQADEESVGDVTSLFNPENTSVEVATKFSKYFDGATLCLADKCRKKEYNRVLYASPLYTGSEGGAGGTSLLVPHIVLKDSLIIFVRQYASCERQQTSIAFNSDGTPKLDENGDEVTYTHTANYCATLTFDTNGPAAPNQFGADIFELYVKADGKFSGWSYTGWDSLQSILQGKDPIYFKYSYGQQKP